MATVRLTGPSLVVGASLLCAFLENSCVDSTLNSNSSAIYSFMMVDGQIKVIGFDECMQFVGFNRYAHALVRVDGPIPTPCSVTPQIQCVF